MSVGNLIRYGLPFSNVVATGVATSQITPGRTLETYRLKLGGTALTKAMLSLLKVKANGKVIIEASGTELDKINSYRGVTADAAYLDIDFADDKMLTQFDRMVSAFDTSSGIMSLTTEYKACPAETVGAEAFAGGDVTAIVTVTITATKKEAATPPSLFI